MPAVKVKENEPVDIAIRRFKRACEKAGVLADVRKKEFLKNLPKSVSAKKLLQLSVTRKKCGVKTP